MPTLDRVWINGGVMKPDDAEDDPFIKHAALIFRQDGCKVSEARFKAWCEGPEGYAKRLEQETSDILKYVEVIE